MAKHNPRSLLERAAEVYDFGAALARAAPAPRRSRRAPSARRAGSPAPVAPASPVAELQRRPLAAPSVAGPRRGPRTAWRRDRPRRARRGRLHRSRRPGDRTRRGIPAGQAPAARRDRGRRSSPRSAAAPSWSARPSQGGQDLLRGQSRASLAGERMSRCCWSTAISPSPTCSPCSASPAAPAWSTRSPILGVDPESFVIRTDVPGLSVLPAGAQDQ